MTRNSFSLTRFLIFFLSLTSLLMASAAEPFFFVQLSDPQFGMFTTNRDFVQETASFEFAIASINRLRPAFVVITGDLVNKPGDSAQITEFKRIAAKLDSRIPLYNVAGNHDIQNTPTPESVAAFTNQFGPDYYEFRHEDFVGIVLDSTLIHAPDKAHDLYAGQEAWLGSELEKISKQKPAHIVIFQHHSWFLNAADEPDEYFNIPTARRTNYLALFHKYRVKYAFCGHYHRNKIARDDDLEVVTTTAVGKPLAGQSGMRIVVVRDNGIEHQFYTFGDIPNHIDPKAKLPRSSLTE